MRIFLQHYFLLFSEKTDSWEASNKGTRKRDRSDDSYLLEWLKSLVEALNLSTPPTPYPQS